MWTRLILATLLLGGFVLAQDDSDPCLIAVKKLGEIVRDSDASWADQLEAYKRAKVALEGGNEECTAHYERIRPAVANALRRDEIRWDGILLGFFGATLMWGGFTFCLAIAWKSGKSGTEED